MKDAEANDKLLTRRVAKAGKRGRQQNYEKFFPILLTASSFEDFAESEIYWDGEFSFSIPAKNFSTLSGRAAKTSVFGPRQRM
jgi:hypothetical protein